MNILHSERSVECTDTKLGNIVLGALSPANAKHRHPTVARILGGEEKHLVKANRVNAEAGMLCDYCE